MKKDDDFKKWFVDLYNHRENYIEYIRDLTDSHEYTVFYGCGAIFKLLDPIPSCMVL